MHRTIVATFTAAAVLAAGGAALAGTSQFRSHPVGTFEVPANDSGAEASFKLKLAPDGQSARYDLKITDAIENVTQAHLHVGESGVSGPIVVWLYPSAPPATLIPGTTEGRLASGTITPDDLVNVLAGDWDGFVEALEAGRIYVNVHTLAFPPGEIRDQVQHHPG